ncbi:MAG: hypothetical protein ACRCZZ_00620 [Phocaeicola sp.]
MSKLTLKDLLPITDTIGLTYSGRVIGNGVATMFFTDAKDISKFVTVNSYGEITASEELAWKAAEIQKAIEDN